MYLEEFKKAIHYLHLFKLAMKGLSVLLNRVAANDIFNGVTIWVWRLISTKKSLIGINMDNDFCLGIADLLRCK
jgi:hypothetical protein